LIAQQSFEALYQTDQTELYVTPCGEGKGGLGQVGGNIVEGSLLT
jgi:hypothetical protein